MPETLAYKGGSDTGHSYFWIMKKLYTFFCSSNFAERKVANFRKREHFIQYSILGPQSIKLLLARHVKFGRKYLHNTYEMSLSEQLKVWQQPETLTLYPLYLTRKYSVSLRK
jgi:hypothetical protein